MKKVNFRDQPPANRACACVHIFEVDAPHQYIKNHDEPCDMFFDIALVTPLDFFVWHKAVQSGLVSHTW